MKVFVMSGSPISERNRKLLDGFFDHGLIQVKRSDLFAVAPGPVRNDFDYGRAEGMMLGLAIGDALGITTEGMLPARRRELHGEIRDYLPNRYVKQPIGFPSDDTQLAFWTLEQMIEDGGFIPENVARRLCQDRIFGIGRTVKAFIRNHKAGKPWYECGPQSAGNGALMRIAPMVIPHLAEGTNDLWVDTALSAMMTHNDAASIVACLAFVYQLRQLLEMDRPPQPVWWAETYVKIARDLEGETRYQPRSGPLVGQFEGPVWKMVEGKVMAAFMQDLSVKEACEWWYSGAYLLETVPSVLYILMRHGHDPEEAIVRAVNDTKDNDTIAAIVGAAVGALHGKRAFPDRWVRNLSGRTTDRDDGKVHELLSRAKQAFLPA